MPTKLAAFGLIVSTFFYPFHSAYASDDNLQIVMVEDVNWGYLNPLRGDMSPSAANLWGDRTIDSATGMLVKFNKGFSSPPHIHNVSYRGIVIDGLLHNDDPSAEKSWLATGSFWTQPAGQNHITAASGDSNLIYLEIDEGPYLVQPSKEQFDNGEHPINLHQLNMVWLGHDESALIDSQNASIVHLWRNHVDGLTSGVLIKLASEFAGKILSDGNSLRSVVISGEVNLNSKNNQTLAILKPGSYFASNGRSAHWLSANSESILYLRYDGKLRIIDQ